MMPRTLLAAALLAGCGPDDATDPTEPPPPPPTDTDTTDHSFCGDVTTHNLTMAGLIVDATGYPVEGAEARVEEYNWDNRVVVYGSATTDALGAFSLQLTGVVSVEDCWATALDYKLIGELGGLYGEMLANQTLFGAIDGGSLHADVTAFPLVIQ